MSEFNNDHSDNQMKRTPARKKLADLKAVAPLLIDEGDGDTETNIALLRKKDVGLYKPNEELIQTTARIKTQRDLICERMKKMDQSRSKVSKTVFEKVYRDYAMQLESITHLLDEKKAVLKKELKSLYLALEKKTLDINRHKEILEEAQFRHYLEEFTEEQYKEVEEFETREISQLQQDLSQIQAYLRTHEELFDPQDLGLTPKAPIDSEATRTIAPVQKTNSPVSPRTQQETVIKQAPRNLESSLNKIQQPIILDKKEEIQSLPQTSGPIDPSSNLLDEPIELDEPESIEPMADELSAEPQFNEAEMIEEDSSAENEAAANFVAEHFHEADTGPSPSLEEQPAKEPDYYAVEESQPKIITEPSISKVEEQAPPKIQQQEAPAALIKEEKPEAQSVMDILGDIALDEEISETHSHVAGVSSHSIPPAAAASSAANGEYKLVFIEAEGPIDVNEFVVRDNVSIGRSPSNDLVLKAPKASRQHAAINKYKDQYLLIDLKSSNGVFVNGKKIEEHSLQDGDEVSVGGYKMIFKKS